MAKGGAGSAKGATVGRPKAVTVGRAAPGNFTFTTNKGGVGAASRSANVGSRPAGIKVGRNKKGK